VTGARDLDDLRAIQLRYGFLPKAELKVFANAPRRRSIKFTGVASFYPHFISWPPPKAKSRLCRHELPSQRRLRVRAPISSALREIRA